MRRCWHLITGVALLCALPAFGQGSDLGAPCSRAAVPNAARGLCHTVAQAVESAQPQLGILLTAGNPTLGEVSSGGLRLGIFSIPGVGATAKLNVAAIRLPEIIGDGAGSGSGGERGVESFLAPALSGSASVELFRGLSLAPTVGGIGSVALLGSLDWLPLSTFGPEGFESASSTLAYGGGVRIGLLRESFTIPGVALFGAYRRAERLAYGNVCSTPLAAVEDHEQSYTLVSGTCAGEGDPGEFATELDVWSARAMAGKRLLGLGIAGGVGLDRVSGDLAFGIRPPLGSTPAPPGYFVRASDLSLETDRWSAFVDLSYGFLIGAFSLEAGWMQGEEPLTGFPDDANEFDPREGTFFGSAGVRIAI